MLDITTIKHPSWQIADVARACVHNYCIKNAGEYPTHILVHPKTYFELVDDLHRMQGYFDPHPHNLRFMGALLIDTQKVKEGEFICLGNGNHT